MGNEACVAIAHFTHQCPALSKEWGSPPSQYRMALARGDGKAAAAAMQLSPTPEAQCPQEKVDKEARQRERLKEEETSLLARMKSQDDTIATLRKQNVVMGSQLKELNNQVLVRDPSS